MRRPTGPGQTERRSSPPSLLLYNFDIDDDHLKREHVAFLREAVVPALREGGSVAIVGLASRSGSASYNQRLSLRRANHTFEFLRKEVGPTFQARQIAAFGEQAAAREGYRDGSEDARFRSVLLFVEKSSVPPSPPSRIDITPEVPGIPIPEDGILDTLGKVLDWAGFGAGILELIAAGALASFAEIAGLVTGIVSPILGLPAAWLAGDRLARFNGACQGFWEAMQDMASAYSSPGLARIPESQWPPVPHPRPHHAAGPPTLVADRYWRQGQAEGCEAAYQAIVKMDRQPVEKKVTVQGRPITLRLTGKLFLALMYRAHGRNVWRAIQNEVNKRLRARGRGEWPIIK